jgi:hypothetical protein
MKRKNEVSLGAKWTLNNNSNNSNTGNDNLLTTTRDGTSQPAKICISSFRF